MRVDVSMYFFVFLEVHAHLRSSGKVRKKFVCHDIRVIAGGG